MAVTYASGAEGRQDAVDGVVLTNAVYSTAQARTGAASYRCNPASGIAAYVNLIGISSLQYLHFGMYVTTLPSVARNIAGVIGAAGALNLKLTPTGALALYDNATLLGTSSGTPFASPGWHWIGFRGSTGSSVVMVQIDGANAITGTATVANTTALVGLGANEASAADLYIDDIVVDSAGFLAPSKVDFALPISNNTITGVTDGNNTNGGDVWRGVANVPPAGVASASESVAGNFNTIVRFPASTTCDFIVNLESYTDLGVASSDTLIMVQPVVRHGEDIATGTKNLQNVGAISNPIVAGGAQVAGNDGGAHGAEPGLWATRFGTITTTGLNSLTYATNPTIRATRASESRVACVDFMGLLVVWTPAASGTTQNGAASLSGAGTFAPGSSVKLAGALAATGALSVAVGGGKLANAASAMAGVGTLSGSGGLVAGGVSSLSGTGAVSFTGARVASGALDIAGAGTVSAAPRITYAGSSSLTGTGSLAPSGGLALGGALAAAGAGTVGATGALTRIGASSLSGAGTVAFTGQLVSGGAASIAGIGATTAAAGLIFVGGLSVSGTGSIAPTGRLTLSGAIVAGGVGLVDATTTGGGTQNGSATLAGAGTMSAAGSRLVVGGSSLIGAATMSAPGGVVLSGVAAQAGSGTVSAGAGVTRQGAFSAAGAGTLAAGGSIVSSGALAISGTGSLAGSGRLMISGVSAATGTGSILAQTAGSVVGSASLAGAGTLAATGGATFSGVVSLTGSGSVTAVASKAAGASATIAGAGQLLGTSRLVSGASASLAGSASVSSAGGLIRKGTADLFGQGFVSATPLFSAPLGFGVRGAVRPAVASGSVSVVRQRATLQRSSGEVRKV